MYLRYIEYTFPLFFAAAVSAGVALLVWRRRPAPGASAFAVLMLAVAEWAFCYGMEVGASSLPAKIIWLKLEYPGIVLTPVAWLVFTLQFAGHGERLTARRLSLLLVIPFATVLLAWTNEFHDLIWRDIVLEAGDRLPLLDLAYGAWFPVHVTYSYALLLVGTLWLIRAFRYLSDLYRVQIVALLFGVLAPWVWNVLYLAGIGPLADLDVSPYVLTVSGLVVAWTMFRYQLFDVGPVARDAVIESMDDGVLVLDAENRVVDVNPAALRLLNARESDVIGEPAGQVCANWPHLVERYREVRHAHTEVVVGKGERQRHYDLQISPLYDRHRRLRGRLIVLRDITDRKRAEEEREHLLESEREQRLLAETLTEVTLALTSYTERDSILDEILRQAQRLVPYTSANIALVEQGTLRPVRWQGYEEFGGAEFVAGLVQPLSAFPYDAEAVERGEPIVIPDTYNDPRWVVFGETAWIRSDLIVPIRSQDRVLGLLRLDSDQVSRFTETDARRLRPLANAAAIALENARLLDETRQRVQELKVLHQVALDVTAQLEPSRLLEEIVRRAAELLEAEGGSVYLYDDGRQELESVVSYNQGRDYSGTRLQLGEGLSGRVVEQRQLLTVDDYRTWPGRACEKFKDAPCTAVIAAPLQVGERVLGVLAITDEAEDRVFGADDERLAKLFAAQAAVALENARLYQDLEDAYVQTVSALANAVDVRDTYTGHHSQQLAEWAVATGEELGCREEQLEVLRWAALLHDIGKIGVPDSVLQKPGPLNREERAIIERHPEIGEQIVAPVKKLAGVAPVIRSHQERWDGTGYPDGLKGEEIPLEARILAVVDAYGAMIDERVYREAMSCTEAVVELKRCAGTQFDPQVVDAFLRVLECA